MKKNKKKYYIVLVLALILGGLFIFKDTVEIFDEKIPKGTPIIDIVKFGAIADSNYYNQNDGNYYKDADFQVLATDNTDVFQKALNHYKIIYIPNGNYLISGALQLKGDILEILGEDKLNTKLLFSANRIKKANTNAKNETVIVNHGLSYGYNHKSSQNITFKNLTMEYNRDDNKKPKTLLLVGNLNGALFDNIFLNVYNSSEIKDIQITNLDLYAACKNVTIKNSTFINDTSGPAGGCIWVRNLTTQKENLPENKTQNISIENNEFFKNSEDEIIAVFSSRGDVENVTIKENKFTTHGVAAEINLAVYSAKDNNYGKVSSVLIENNLFDIHDFNAFIVKIGNAGNNMNPTSNVTIRNNTINVSSNSDSLRAKRVIYQADTISNEIYIENNNLNYISQHRNRIYGITCKSGYVLNNKIVGNFYTGIEYGEVKNNWISGSSVGIFNPTIAEGNTIDEANTGIKLAYASQHISNNDITLNKNDLNNNVGIEILSNAGNLSNMLFQGNTVYTFNNDTAYHFANETIRFDDNTNKNIGEGKLIYLSNNTILLSMND